MADGSLTWEDIDAAEAAMDDEWIAHVNDDLGPDGLPPIKIQTTCGYDDVDAM